MSTQKSKLWILSVPLGSLALCIPDSECCEPKKGTQNPTLPTLDFECFFPESTAHRLIIAMHDTMYILPDI